MTEPKRGVIVRVHGGHYFVLDEDGREVDCTMRGRMKRERLDTKIIAIGDEVLWTPAEEGTGIIEEVLPRRSVLAAGPAPRTRRACGGYTPPEQHTEQVLIQPHQVLWSFPSEPLAEPLMLTATRWPASRRAPVVMVANKVDLVEEDEDLDIGGCTGLGYTVPPPASRRARGSRGSMRRCAPARCSRALGGGQVLTLNALWPELTSRPAR